MEIFGGLKPGQAVGWVDTETGETRYVIKLPDWISRHRATVKTGDGDQVHYDSGQVVLPGRYDFMPPDLFAFIEIPGEVRGSWDQDGNYHTVEERERVRKEYFDLFDEDGDIVCDDIDKEYEARKRYQQLFRGAVLDREEPTVEQHELDIEIIGWWEPTGSRFIKTPYQQASVYWRTGSSQTGIYKLMTSDVVRDAIAQWIKRNPGEQVESEDRPQFIKIGEKFALSNLAKKLGCIEQNGQSEVFTSLTGAQKREEELRELIHTRLDMVTDNTPLSKPTAMEVVQWLETIETRIRVIEAKAKSDHDRRIALKTVREHRDKIMKAYQNEST